MPLTDLQRMVAKVIRPYRTVSNFVGGGAALNRRWSRISDDLDLYTESRTLPRSALDEIEALRGAGFSVDVIVANDSTVEAIVKQYGFDTRLQWMDDPEISKHFFPATDDEELGFRLHETDNAVNKVLCAARRNRAARDAADLVTIVEQYASLGPLVWAVCGKDESLTPVKVIRDLVHARAGEACTDTGARRGCGLLRRRRAAGPRGMSVRRREPRPDRGDCRTARRQDSLRDAAEALRGNALSPPDR